MKIIRKLKYPITIILFILIIIYIVFTQRKLDEQKYESIDIVSAIEKKETKENNEVIKYHVDIKGAIKNPGVYLVDSNLTVNDQTCTIMIQKLTLLFARNPLNIKEI